MYVVSIDVLDPDKQLRFRSGKIRAGYSKIRTGSGALGLSGPLTPPNLVKTRFETLIETALLKRKNCPEYFYFSHIPENKTIYHLSASKSGNILNKYLFNVFWQCALYTENMSGRMNENKSKPIGSEWRAVAKNIFF